MLDGPANRHDDPEYVRATHHMRVERAKRPARMARWELGIALLIGPIIFAAAVITRRWLGD